MASHTVSSGQKPHVVCVPFPAQGHINPMLKVAKLLHGRGFHVTFVNNLYNHNRLLRSRGPNALDAVLTFRFEQGRSNRFGGPNQKKPKKIEKYGSSKSLLCLPVLWAGPGFESIHDGLPKTDGDTMQEVNSLCEAILKNCLAPFKELLQRINARDDVPPVSCIVSDGCMSFTLDAAEELGVPEVLFGTTSACGFMAYLYFHSFIEKGLCPFKDESYLTKEYLDTKIDWIPSMRNLKLKDIPTFIRATNPDDIQLNFLIHEADQVQRASAIILNTFDDLEHDIIQSLQSILPQVYPIGPLHLLVNRDIDEDSEMGRMGSNLWREETECLDWLDTKSHNSVVYVNFGSIAVMSAKQLLEFAWGLAATGKDFLWVIRPDLVDGDAPMLPLDFLEETADRRMLATWCPQEKVLAHPAIGGFLTHSGWNSTLESLCGGVPMVCWPFFAEQTTNCKFCCDEWGVGMEIGGDVGREEVHAVVRELMDGEKGKGMRKKAEEWRRLAEKATEHTRGFVGIKFSDSC